MTADHYSNIGINESLGTRAALTYLDQLARYHKQHGTNLNRFPSVDKRPLDLYKLKKAVETRSGFDRVCKLKKWAEVGRELGYSGKIMSSLSTSLKNSYQRWLLPYEEYLRYAKPGVQQQLEFEYGGPMFTPSPAGSPMKRSMQNTPSSLRAESPAVRASEALHASLRQDSNHAPETKPAMDVHQTPISQPALAPNAQAAIASSGFTAVNHSGGFTPVNSAPATFTPISAPRRDRDEGTYVHPRHPPEPLFPSVQHTPEPKVSAMTSLASNGFTTNPSLKRQMSQESLDSGHESQDEVGEQEGRRSKRLKKGITHLFWWIFFSNKS